MLRNIEGVDQILPVTFTAYQVGLANEAILYQVFTYGHVGDTRKTHTLTREFEEKDPIKRCVKVCQYETVPYSTRNEIKMIWSPLLDVSYDVSVG